MKLWDTPLFGLRCRACVLVAYCCVAACSVDNSGVSVDPTVGNGVQEPPAAGGGGRMGGNDPGQSSGGRTPPEPGSQSKGGTGGAVGVGGAGGGSPMTSLCESGAMGCEGKVPRRCEGGDWVAKDPCEFTCLAGRCAGACEPSAKQCSDPFVAVCSQAGEWQNQERCPFFCDEARCAGDCAPGSRRCAGKSTEVCSMQGKWQAGDLCPFVCQSGSCAGQCEPGKRLCAGKQSRVCDVNGQWQTAALCDNICLDGSCAGACKPGQEQCQGKTPFVCDGDAQWRAKKGEACPFLCQGGQCAGVCSPGVAKCDGQNSVRCESDAQWRVLKTCNDACFEGGCWSFISKVGTAPRIDGMLKDLAWSDVWRVVAHNIGESKASDVDLSARWQARWDDLALFVFVEVTDDILVLDSEAAWQDDGVELYIDADHNRGSSYDGKNDWQLVFRPKDQTIYPGARTPAIKPGITFDFDRGPQGYRFEARVPWSALGVGKAPSAFGFDVHVNDDDDGASRDHKRAWNDRTDQAWQDPRTFGSVRIVP